MEHYQCCDGGNGHEYPSSCESGWSTMSYDMWSNGYDHNTGSGSFSSPAAGSLHSSCFSTESGYPTFSNTRRSSIVSAAISNWSDSLVTPPVTPQSTKWCSLTSIELFAKPLPQLSFCTSNITQDCQGGEDNLWAERRFQSPMLPIQHPQIHIHDYGNGGMQDESPIAHLSSQIYDPSLSRQIFTDLTHGQDYQLPGVHHINQSNATIWSTPQTVEPKATLQAAFPSSPMPKLEGSSPIEIERFGPSEIGLDSSPIPAPSPRIVPSQRFIEAFDVPCDTIVPLMRPTLTRRLCHRGPRRPCGRKALVSQTNKPRSSTDGIACDAIIPQNTFACTFPGCIDKSTGRQKRFKRQEHRKRHELTVHKGEKKYICWVPGCSTGFNRTDNLKNHIQRTHGKNSPAQRNRYVATLDTASKYYDPQWQGGLTDDGFPLIECVSLLCCSIPSCDKIYHLRDKLRTHMLQQHGKKSSNSDTAYIAELDESSDFFDPDWEEKIIKEEASV